MGRHAKLSGHDLGKGTSDNPHSSRRRNRQVALVQWRKDIEAALGRRRNRDSYIQRTLKEGKVTDKVAKHKLAESRRTMIENMRKILDDVPPNERDSFWRLKDAEIDSEGCDGKVVDDQHTAEDDREGGDYRPNDEQDEEVPDSDDDLELADPDEVIEEEVEVVNPDRGIDEYERYVPDDFWGDESDGDDEAIEVLDTLLEEGKHVLPDASGRDDVETQLLREQCTELKRNHLGNAYARILNTLQAKRNKKR